MALILQSFETIDQASAALNATGTRYLGGGTLVVRAASEGDLSFSSYVCSTDPALTRIWTKDGSVHLGAGVTMAAIARNEELAPLAKAARAVGGPAVRNMATVGGNLFAPAPYGDFAVALVALDATVETGGRQIRIDEFLIGRDAIKSIVTGVTFAMPAAGVFRFVKISRTKPKGVSVLSIATLIETDTSGVIKSARIALGCMADRPIRAKAAEEALIGATLTAEGITPAVAAVSRGIDPITDPIASAWYRGEVLPVHFRRLLLG